MKAFLVTVFLLNLLMRGSIAQTIPPNEPKMPEWWLHHQTRLVLNGSGFREYGLFNIKLYAAALYLSQRDNSAEAILNSSTIRVIHVKVLRNVSREDSIKGWNLYLEANCKAPCALESEAQRIFDLAIPESIAGDTQTFLFANQTLEMFQNGKRIATIENASFARTVLATWIGEHPSTVNLKLALLGKR
jgi:Chalcone isomerase-like